MKFIYNILLLVGTTYLVGWCGWSKWTYVFMMFFIELEEFKSKSK